MFAVLAIVLLIVLPHPWGLVGFGVALACFLGEPAFWHRRVRGSRAVVGPQTLVGEQGTVVSPCRPAGQVRVQGEIWAAHCDAGADVGETVEVIGRRRLILVVKPVAG